MDLIKTARAAGYFVKTIPSLGRVVIQRGGDAVVISDDKVFRHNGSRLSPITATEAAEFLCL